MKRTRLTAVSLVAAVIVGFTSVAALANTPPRPGAIHLWRSTVLTRENLTSWWRGYLGNTRLRGCKIKRIANGDSYYDCRVENRIDGLVLAVASLIHVERCDYISVVTGASPGTTNRTLKRSFHDCR